MLGVQTDYKDDASSALSRGASHSPLLPHLLLISHTLPSLHGALPKYSDLCWPQPPEGTEQPWSPGSTLASTLPLTSSVALSK